MRTDFDSGNYSSYLSDDLDEATRQRMRSWLDWKDEGKRFYEQCDYRKSLACYRSALQPEYECPTNADKAVLLSNAVACRLQLVESSDGVKDLAMARAAVQDAKQCVALNPKWSKGHLRLASAYIAIGDRSNDACNSLQTVLRLDSGNATARQMLMKELRRDHRERHEHNRNNSESHRTNNEVQTSNSNTDPASLRDPPLNPQYVPSSTPQPTSTSSSSRASSQNRSRTTAGPPASDVDDGLSWRERFSFYQSRAVDWYNGLNSDLRTLLKLALVVLALYIAFGGRFGWRWENATLSQQQQSHSSYPYRAEQSKPSSTSTRGNYGAGNAYDEYYKQKHQQQQQHYTRPQGVDSSYHHQRRASSSYESSYYDNNAYHDPPPRRRSSGGLFNSGFSVADLFDGSPISMAILLGIGYLAHRNGINPFQAIMMLNMIGGGRRGGGMYFGGGPFGRRRGGRFRF